MKCHLSRTNKLRDMSFSVSFHSLVMWTESFLLVHISIGKRTLVIAYSIPKVFKLLLLCLLLPTIWYSFLFRLCCYLMPPSFTMKGSSFEHSVSSFSKDHQNPFSTWGRRNVSIANTAWAKMPLGNSSSLRCWLFFSPSCRLVFSYSRYTPPFVSQRKHTF